MAIFAMVFMVISDLGASILHRVGLVTPHAICQILATHALFVEHSGHLCRKPCRHFVRYGLRGFLEGRSEDVFDIVIPGHSFPFHKSFSAADDKGCIPNLLQPQHIAYYNVFIQKQVLFHQYMVSL